MTETFTQELCGPRQSVIKFESLSDDTSFLLPAFTRIECVIGQKLTAPINSGIGFNLAASGEDPFMSASAGGVSTDGDLLQVTGGPSKMWAVEKTIEITATAAWDGRVVNLWIVLSSLGEE